MDYTTKDDLSKLRVGDTLTLEDVTVHMLEKHQDSDDCENCSICSTCFKNNPLLCQKIPDTHFKKIKK